MKSTPVTRTISSQVRQILNLYALAIITAAVGAITWSLPAEAKVVYTPANVVIKNSTYNLDLNGDGITDFAIPESDSSSVCPLAGNNLTALLNVTPTQGNGVVGSGGLAAALGKGALIGRNRGMYSTSELLMESVKIGYFESNGGCVYEDIEKGNWLGGSNGYLGFAFRINGKYHFGWAQLNVQLGFFHGSYSFNTTLTGYAYETVAGKPITAGQTQDSTDDSTASQNLPQENSATMLESKPR